MTDVTAPFDPLAAQLPANPCTPRISACMIAKDASRTIADSLLSLRFCDQIVVIVDAASSDNTEAIARSLAHHVEVREWEGFSPAWKYALSKGEGDWLLMIAADEIVTPVLAQSILAAIAHDRLTDVEGKENRLSACSAQAESLRSSPLGEIGTYDGFLFRRRTRFLGRCLKHGDWGRDYVLRLVRRSKYEFNDALIHESLKHPGSTRLLDGLLLHEGERTIAELQSRQERYTTLSAQQMQALGRHASVLAILLKPPFRFLRSYILRLGFLDGRQGLSLAWYSAAYVYRRYAKLRALNRLSSAGTLRSVRTERP